MDRFTRPVQMSKAALRLPASAPVAAITAGGTVLRLVVPLETALLRVRAGAATVAGKPARGVQDPSK